MACFLKEYNSRLVEALQLVPQANVEKFFDEVLKTWRKDAQLFLCGNGGSAANALHIANDIFYGIAKKSGRGIRAQALSANQSIITCLANDTSYPEIFSRQLAVLANPGDMLVVLSGSGNSPNIIKALEFAREQGLLSVAILGYSGGAALGLADIPVHIPVNDMQISEDLQLVIGHALMQWLCLQNV